MHRKLLGIFMAAGQALAQLPCETPTTTIYQSGPLSTITQSYTSTYCPDCTLITTTYEVVAWTTNSDGPCPVTSVITEVCAPTACGGSLQTGGTLGQSGYIIGAQVIDANGQTTTLGPMQAQTTNLSAGQSQSVTLGAAQAQSSVQSAQSQVSGSNAAQSQSASMQSVQSQAASSQTAQAQATTSGSNSASGTSSGVTATPYTGAAPKISAMGYLVSSLSTILILNLIL